MTQKEINFLINFFKLFAVIVLTAFCVILCYQFVILNGLKNQKKLAEANLHQVLIEQEKNQQKLNYLQENYNQFLDDIAKDELGLTKKNQTVIYGG